MNDDWGILNVNNLITLKSNKSNICGSVNEFDPYQSILKRRKMDIDNISVSSEISNHAVEDIKELEEFCQKHGIIGFNCGKTSPKLALRMLKSKIGIKEESPIIPQTKSIICG